MNDLLRRDIAIKKGWKVWLGTCGKLFLPPNIKGKTPVFEIDPEEKVTFLIKHNKSNWPNYIRDAWELVDEATNAGVPFLLKKEHDFWCASFDDLSVESGETAPEAICKSWMAWKNNMEKEVP